MRLPLPLLLLGLVLSLTVGPVLAAPSASVADLVLPDIGYSHVSRTSSGSLLLTASNDGSAGFSVTVEASEFGYSGPYSGLSIPASNFAITNAHPPTMSAGQAVDTVGGPRVPAAGAAGPLSVPRKTVQADAGFGVGTYTQALDVALTVPGQSRAGTYTATITTTISAGP